MPDEQPTLPPVPEGATLPPSASPAAAPRGLPQVPGYEVLDRLGEGGMGVVYRARQAGLDREVALKMILAGSHAGEQDLERFLAEARAIARLRHPNIVQIHEVGEHEGKPYFSLEFCAGGSLDRKLAGTPLPPREAAVLVAVLARATQAAHYAGIVHRDLKPANVLLSAACGLADAVPKITDFGLAKQLDAADRTRTGAILGTPSYMAPEQAEGRKDVGPPADVYALGAILYECLTGRPPFRAASPLETILQVVADEPAAPRVLQPSVPRDLDTVTLKCLEKDPAGRYPSAQELADDLERFLRDEAVRARRPGLAERGLRWARKQRRQLVLAVSAAAAALLLPLAAALALARYAESRKGALELTTDGPALTAEVFEDREGAPLGQRFRVPTVDPVRLPAGVHKVRLSGPGLLGEEYRVLIDHGGRHVFDVELRHDLWPAITTDAEQVHFLPRPGGTDLLLQGGGGVRRLDGVTGRQTTWGPKGMSLAGPPLEPVVDLDGDGWADPVWPVALGTSLPGVLAVSGKDGKALLHHTPTPPPPFPIPEGKAKVVSFTHTQVRAGGLVAVPAAGRARRRDLVALFLSQASSWAVPGEPKPRAAGRQFWLERFALDGKALWRYRLDPAWSPGGSEPSPPRLATVAGRQVAGIATPRRLLTVDLATGRDAWPPRPLPGEVKRWVGLADLAGDGRDDALLVLAGPRLAAVPLDSRLPLWEVPLDAAYLAPQAGVAGSLRASEYDPLLTPPDSRGVRGVAVLVSGEHHPRNRWEGVELLDGRTGRPRWRARLLKNISTQPDHLAVSRWCLANAPDLDGDGVPDLVVGFLSSGQEAFFLYALSGADGRTLWWARHDPLAAVEPLLWWPPGSGRQPLLVARVGSPLVSAAPRAYFLDGATGRLVHTLLDSQVAGVADLDGDGLPELVYVHQVLSRRGRIVRRSGRGQLHAIRGQPPAAWRWLGVWEPIQDLDGDGWPDVVHRSGNTLAAVSTRTGRLLWPRLPGAGPAATAGEPDATQPTRESGDGTVLALPGRAELLVVDQGRRPVSSAEENQLLLPLRSVSTADGRTNWLARGIGTGRPNATLARVFRPSTGPPLVLASALVSDWETGLPGLELVLLTGDTGVPLWRQSCYEKAGRGGTMPVGANARPALADAGRVLALWVPIPQPGKFVSAFELHGYRVADGERLWRRPLSVAEEYQGRVWDAAAPAVAELDGRPAVLVRDQLGVHALDARTGALLWRFDEPAPLPMTPDHCHSPALVDRAGQTAVALGTFGKHPPELVLLDARGKEVQRRPLPRQPPSPLPVVPWSADLRGDGRCLLVAAEGRVWAARGLRPEDEVWSWQPAGAAGELRLAEVWPARGGQPATVVVRAVARQSLFGLRGSDGKVLWRCRAEEDVPDGVRSVALQPPDRGQGGPVRVVSTEDGRDTVCRLALPIGPGGGYRLPPTEGEEPEPPAGDPRYLRPLPWRDMGKFSAVWWALLSLPVLAWLLLIVPLRLGWRALRRPRRWPLLALTGWVLTVVIAIPLLRPDVLELLDAGYVPLGPYLAMTALGALAGLPLLALLGALLSALWRRRLAGLLLLAVLVVCGSLFVVGLVLGIDRPALAPNQRYDTEGWYLVAAPGLWVAGALLLSGRLLRGLWRLLRAAWRRVRKSQPALAPGAAGV
jgi:outer membrane protein assembly factor BamB